MDESTYRRVFAQFLNDYWGAFHEVVEAQSVNPHKLADSLFDEVVAAHERFVAAMGGVDPALGRLGHLWFTVTDRRRDTIDVPLSAREVAHAREQFEAIHDAFLVSGKAFGDAVRDVISHATHGTPKSPLRADAAS